MKKILVLLLAVLIAVPAMAIDITKIKVNGQVRVRAYDLQNVWSFNDATDSDNYSAFRYKTSLSLSIPVEQNISAYIKLTNQHWGNGVGTGENKDANLFIDNAYINIVNFADFPLNITLGRQNLMYGNGFVLFDGQSQTGSTSTYFDGIKLSYAFSAATKLDFLYFKDEENNLDDGSQDDVTLSGIYLTIKKCPVLDQGKREIYILNKNDQSIDKNITMYGLRASNKFNNGIDYSVELAKQTGDYSSTVDQDALGYQLKLGYNFEDMSKTRIFLGYVSLSGDETGSGDNEAWDVFYGGWPQWGDLLAWKYLNLGGANNVDAISFNGSSNVGEAVYSNLNMITLGISSEVIDNVSIKLSYSKITLDESTVSDDFGNYFQLSTNYKYSKSLSFNAYAAMICPGDAWGTTQDNATELFVEADLKF